MVETFLSIPPFCSLLVIQGGDVDEGNTVSERVFQDKTTPLLCSQRGEHNIGGDGEDAAGSRSGQGVTAEGDASRDIKQGI